MRDIKIEELFEQLLTRLDAIEAALAGPRLRPTANTQYLSGRWKRRDGTTYLQPGAGYEPKTKASRRRS